MKIFKKFMLCIVTLIFTLSMISCGSKSPTKVVEDTLESIRNGNEKSITEIFDKNNTDVDSNDEYKESVDKLIKSFKKMDYKINSESINGDTAVVNVTVNGPDIASVLTKFMQNAFSDALSQALSGNSLSESETNAKYDKMLGDLLDKVEYTERTMDINLVKNNGEWTIKNENELVKLVMNIDFDKLEEYFD